MRSKAEDNKEQAEDKPRRNGTNRGSNPAARQSGGAFRWPRGPARSAAHHHSLVPRGGESLWGIRRRSVGRCLVWHPRGGYPGAVRAPAAHGGSRERSLLHPVQGGERALGLKKNVCVPDCLQHPQGTRAGEGRAGLRRFGI
jgi:hypothetical protein